MSRTTRNSRKRQGSGPDSSVSNRGKGKKGQRKQNDEWAIRMNIRTKTTVEISQEELEAKVAFCCALCRCSQEKIEEILDPGDHFIQPDGDSLWHRRCCHNVHKKTKRAEIREWYSPTEIADEEAQAALIEGATGENKVHIVQRREVEEKSFDFESAVSKDTAQADFKARILALESDEEYIERIQHRFKKGARKTRKIEKPIVILDIFAGIGSTIVCLKKLGIKIGTVIHIEQDKVANHVYKYNHDFKYNPELEDDGIDHVYFDTFDDVRKDMARIYDDYGPFNFIAGVPPTAEMKTFGNFVYKIMQYQKNFSPTPIFYFSENARIHGCEDLPLTNKQLHSIKAKYGNDWELCLDSEVFSPVKRLRTYISNIPFSGATSRAIMDPAPETCFENGFALPGTIMKNRKPKVPSTMFTASEQNQKEVLVYKKSTSEGTYIERPLSVLECERLMGFPAGYVSIAIENLFTALLDEGLHRKIDTPGQTWKSKLPPQYHCFGGDYPNFKGEHGETFRFVKNSYPVKLKLAAPLGSNDKPTFFTSDGYSKHLLSNSFSIPTIEFLLRRLIECQVEHSPYPKYEYDFAWSHREVVSQLSNPFGETNVAAFPRQDSKMKTESEAQSVNAESVDCRTTQATNDQPNGFDDKQATDSCLNHNSRKRKHTTPQASVKAEALSLLTRTDTETHQGSHEGECNTKRAAVDGDSSSSSVACPETAWRKLSTHSRMPNPQQGNEALTKDAIHPVSDDGGSCRSSKASCDDNSKSHIESHANDSTDLSRSNESDSVGESTRIGEEFEL